MCLFPKKTDADGQFTNPLKEREKEGKREEEERGERVRQDRRGERREGKTGQKRKEEREMDLPENEACVKFNSPVRSLLAFNTYLSLNESLLLC